MIFQTEYKITQIYLVVIYNQSKDCFHVFVDVLYVMN